MIPAPKNELPWTQERETGPIKDRHGATVGFADNLHYLAGVALQHEPLTAKLKEITDAYELLARDFVGVPERDILAIVRPARELIRRARVEKPSAAAIMGAA